MSFKNILYTLCLITFYPTAFATLPDSDEETEMQLNPQIDGLNNFVNNCCALEEDSNCLLPDNISPSGLYENNRTGYHEYTQRYINLNDEIKKLPLNDGEKSELTTHIHNACCSLIVDKIEEAIDHLKKAINGACEKIDELEDQKNN